jgi:hypothetical protein
MRAVMATVSSLKCLIRRTLCEPATAGMSTEVPDLLRAGYLASSAARNETADSDLRDWTRQSGGEGERLLVHHRGRDDRRPHGLIRAAR